MRFTSFYYGADKDSSNPANDQGGEFCDLNDPNAKDLDDIYK